MKQSIRNNIHKVEELSKVMDINQFYSISIAPKEIRLQGEYCSKLIENIQNTYEVKAKIGENGYVHLKVEKNNILFVFIFTD